MRGKKRPTTERARAVGLALMTGNVLEAERQTGIPDSTIHAWMESDEFGELRNRTKEVVAEEWWAGIQAAFRRTVELLAKTEDPVKAATAGAIMFDKRALSLGEATARSETRDLTMALDDHELELLRAAIHQDAADREAGDSSEVAVAGASQNGAAPSDG